MEINSSLYESDESQVFNQQDRYGRKRRLIPTFAVNLLRDSTAAHNQRMATTRKVHTHGKRPRYL